MGEFSRSGPQMPTEQRREAQAEHDSDLRRAADEHRTSRDSVADPPTRRRPWWRFWERR